MSRRTGKPKTTKKSAKRKSVKKNTPKPKARTRKQEPSVSAEADLKREFQGRNQRSARGAQAQRSADFEGVSRAEQADSESVDELVEEGNIFEAGAVAGVQGASDSDEREVRTHELPEDDIPDEYQDKD